MRSPIILPLLASLLLVHACRSLEEPGARVASKLATYIPPGTAVLAGGDLDQVKRSALYKKNESRVDLSLLNQVSEKTGIDPRRDVSEFLIAWPANQPVTAVQGRFSEAQTAQKLETSGAHRSDYKKHAFFTDRGESLFFPEHNVLVAGPDPLLHAIADGGRGNIPTALKERLSRLSSNDQLWLVSSQSLPLSRVPLRPDLQSALSNLLAYVKGASFGVALSDGARFESNLACVSPAGAKQVHDAIRGGIGLARLTTKDSELDLLKVYDAIQVDQDGQTVHVRADFPPELANRLLAQLSGLKEKTNGILKP